MLRSVLSCSISIGYLVALNFQGSRDEIRAVTTTKHPQVAVRSFLAVTALLAGSSLGNLPSAQAASDQAVSSPEASAPSSPEPQPATPSDQPSPAAPSAESVETAPAAAAAPGGPAPQTPEANQAQPGEGTFGRPAEVEGTVQSSAAPRLRQFGVALNAGISGILPDVGVHFVYRPFRFLRAAAGLGYNLIKPGVQASVTVINPYIIPLSLTGEIGQFFEGDVNSAINRFAGKQTDLAVLQKVGYRYANALLGVELGSRRMTFYIRGGATTMTMNLKGFDQVLKQSVDPNARSSDPKLSYKGPTLKLGLVVYL